MKLKRWEDAPWKDEAEKLVPQLEHWQKAMQAIDALEKELQALFGSNETSVVNKRITIARTSFMLGMELCVGDELEWLDWYSTLNRYGKKCYPVSICKYDTGKPVKSLFDLAVILTAPKTEL
jgi:hypothetical protein